MVLDNKLGLTNSAELAKQEELLTKKRAKELFESGKIEDLEIGTFQGLSDIHQFLFQDIYDFAGNSRSEYCERKLSICATYFFSANT